MKKIYLLALLVFGAIYSSNAQDLIINADGDSLNVKILNIKEDRMSFVYKKNSQVKNFIVPLSRIKEYQKGFYKSTELTEKDLTVVKFNHVSIKFHGGYSQLLAKTSKEVPLNLTSYARALKSGSHFGADVAYFWSKTSGVGLKGVIFKSKNETTYNAGFFNGPINDNITIAFVAPSYYAKAILNDGRSAFYTNISLGLMTYNNKGSFGSSYKINANMLGGGLDIGFDIALSDYISINLGTGLVAGAFKTFNIDDTTTGAKQQKTNQNPENISRLDVSGGLRFSF